MNRSWILIIISALLEVFWVTGFKYADNWVTWAATIATLLISFSLIIVAARKLPVGTVYAVFTGLGTAGTVLAEIVIFGEPVKLAKVLLIGLLLVGVLGLKLIDNPAGSKEVEG